MSDDHADDTLVERERGPVAHRDRTPVVDGRRDAVLERTSDILWRLSGDRVMTHRVNAPPESAANDLVGLVALVWLALDEHATRGELESRLADANVTLDDLDAELDRLLAAGLVVERSAGPIRSEAAGEDVVDEPVDQPPGEPADRLVEELLVEVGSIAVFDTTVQVSSAPQLVDELRHGLTNLGEPLLEAVQGSDVSAGSAGSRDDAADASTSTHHLALHRRGDVWTVRWDGEARHRGRSTGTALYDALINLNHHASRRATELGWTVLHGGAVAIGGQAIAVVGHSGAGKSTLTTALTRRGHAYVADEVVAVRENFTVAPFHRPIGLRSGGADQIDVDVPDGPYEHVMPYHVSGPLGGGAPLGLVAILRRTDEPTEARLEDLGGAAALFVLANQTLGATDVEREVFWRLDRLVRSIRVVELHYADVADAIGVLERFAGETDR